MSCEDNLIKPTRDLTPEQRRESARQAGKASARKRREKREMREMARDILEMPLREGGVDEVRSMAEVKGKNVTVMEAALLVQAQKALAGDTRAFEMIRDTAGMKPVERVEVAEDVTAAAADIKRMIAAAKAKDDGR